MLRALPLYATVVMAMSLPQSALAQSLSTKDAWDVISGFIQGASGRLTSTGMVRDGDALIAQGARLEAGEALVMRFDQIRLEPRGTQVAVIPSARFDVTSTLGGEGERRDYVVTHDGEFLMSADATRADLDLAFGQLMVVKSAATRQGRPLDEHFEMTHTGLTGRIGVTLDEPYEVRVDLRADEVAQEQRVNDPTLMLEQDVEGVSRGLRLQLSIDGLRAFDVDQPGWFRTAFEGGLAVDLESSNDSGAFQLDQTTMGIRSQAEMTLQASVGTVRLVDGMLDIAGTLDGVAGTMEIMGTQLATTLGQMSIVFGMPVIVTEDERPFRFSMGLEELTLDGPALSMIGAGDFAGEPISALVDTRVTGRLLVDFDSDPDDSQMPFDISRFDLSGLTLGLGAAALTGEGGMTLAPGALEAVDEGMPEGEGDFVFELRGGNALLGRLVAAGLVPADQQFMALMMMNALGRPVGDDHLRSEVAIRPGGQLTINGMPLPF